MTLQPDFEHHPSPGMRIWRIQNFKWQKSVELSWVGQATKHLPPTRLENDKAVEEALAAKGKHQEEIISKVTQENI